MAFDKFAGVEQFEAAVKTGQETWNKAVDASRSATQKALADGQEAFVKSYDKAVAMANEQIQKSWPNMAGQFEEITAWQKQQIEVAFKTGDLTQQGVEKVATEVSAIGHKAWEKGVASTKAAMTAKDPQAWVEAQTEQARTAFDDVVSYSTKLSDVAVSVASEIAEPFQAELNKTAAKAAKAPAKKASAKADA